MENFLFYYSPFPADLKMSSNSTCKLSTHGNSTDPFHLGNPYGGIPQNLIINAVGVAAIVVMFFVLRKRAALSWIMRTDDIERLTSRVINVTADTIEKGIGQASGKVAEYIP